MSGVFTPLFVSGIIEPSKTEGLRMKMMLAENIRSFRKARKLTQEQLAEVLGVTPGAVYKWEAGVSQS